MFSISIFLAAAAMHTAAELGPAIERHEPGERPFDVTVCITCPPWQNRGSFYARDKTGCIELHTFPGDWKKIQPGDVFRLKGTTKHVRNRIGVVHADCEDAKFIRHEDATPPLEINAHDFLSGKHLFQFIRLQGVMRNVFRDEIDPEYIYFIIECGDERVFAVFATDKDVKAVSQRMLGAKVAVTGCCSRDADSRTYSDYFINLSSLDSIAIIEHGKDDPFAAKSIADTAALTPKDITVLGRRCARGLVLAAWSKDKVLLKMENGWPILVRLSGGQLPSAGDWIEASGYPDTNLYNIILMQSVWRKCTPGRRIETKPTAISPSQLKVDSAGRPCLNAHMNAKPVAMSGTIMRIWHGRDGETMFALDDGAHSVDVIGGAGVRLQGIAEGCKVQVSGICAMEADVWRPNSIIPKITDISVVVNDANDIRVIETPPWWTPGRFLLAIVILSAALLLISAWNITLRVLVARRSRQLLKSEIAKADAELRIDERTRLAAELHDSVAQNLSGVSLQIDAAMMLAGGERDSTLAKRLKLASTSLKSCRVELRNCLWDLRNQALDEHDMKSAIEHTLSPHIGDTHLFVRFDVPRSVIADNTAHAILRIIRELVSNAINHGKARTVKIAGSCDGRHIMFSVKDDGCGFDPGTVPGMRQGHFGLPGIRERIRKFNGTIDIDSSPGAGTKVSISLERPQKEGKRK